MFIEPVDEWDLNEHVPEAEAEWRLESPAWEITDFFELLKKQFRELKWIPLNARNVIPSDMNFENSLVGVVPMLQKIFRAHGWPAENGGTSIYYKKECLEAVKAAVEKHYPDLLEYYFEEYC